MKKIEQLLFSKMKGSLLSFLFIFNFSFLANPCDAQLNIYHPFPHTNARWGQWCAQSAIRYYYQYSVNGDTTVNSKNYFKVYRSAPSYDSLCCLLREDSANEIMYESRDGGHTEDTLYDFNLNVNDTLPQWKNYWKEYVKKVDSILIGKSYRKMLVVTDIDSSQRDSLIEGIGSSHGLLEEPFIWGTSEFRSVLICFEENDTTVYPYLNYNCSTALAASDFEEPSKAISVFPNPNAGVFTIEAKGEKPEGKSSIEIYNVLGEKVYLQFNIQNPTFKIDLLNQPNGVYLYRIISQNGDLIGEGKLIIAK
jgi:hypothetical protein